MSSPVRTTAPMRGAAARRKSSSLSRRPQKTAKRKSRCGDNGTTCASRRPNMRDLNGGYRTLCVRLCDGFYFPISAAAQPGEFARDEETCQRGVRLTRHAVRLQERRRLA